MAEHWRERLISALKDKKISWRQASIKAGLSEGYVFSLIKEGKDPTLENFRAICAANGLSLTEILLGLPINHEMERILLALAEMPQKKRQALVALLLGDQNHRS